jgi:hypothetical protein
MIKREKEYRMLLDATGNPIKSQRLPALMGLSPGEHHPIPRILIPDYIDFSRGPRLKPTIKAEADDFSREAVRKRILDKTVELTQRARNAAKPKLNKEENVGGNRVRVWLVASTRAERAGNSTAMSCALQNACIQKMQKNGGNPWDVIGPILKREEARAPRRKISSDLKPLWQEMQEAKKKGWHWNERIGAYMRAGPYIPGTILRLGKSVSTTIKKDPFGLSREGGKEEVHCG